MKKTVTLLVAVAFIMLSAMAREFLIRLNNGEEIQIPVKDISEVRFDATSSDMELPEDAYPSALDFSQKMLLMDHTGTQCPNCPLMSMALSELENDPAYASSFTLAAVHSYTGDPMGNALVQEISKPYVANGWPTTTVNFRKNGVGAYQKYQMSTDKIKALIDADKEALVPSGIASIATLEDRKLNLTLSMKAGEEGRYRVGAFVVEDGIKAEQLNQYPEITGDRDFNTHNNVVRTVIGRDADGGFTGIDLGRVRKGETAYTVESIDLGSGWKLENCYLVLYVTEKIGDDYICVNSAYAPINGEAPFEYDSQNAATDDYLTLNKTFVEVSSQNESQTIDFQMAADADAEKVAASTTTTWIKNLTVSGTTISFSVEENTTPIARTGTISVSYDNARPIDITVRQKSNRSDEDAPFIIETSVLTPYSASVSITPNGYEGNYLFLVASAATIDSYINAGNLQGWIDGDIEWLKSLAHSNNLTLAEFLPLYKQAYTMNGEPTIMTYSSLSNNTEYYIYCYGLTLDGEVTTEFCKQKFETKMVDKVDLDFTADITNISRYGADVKVLPSDNENSYFWTYVSEMDWVKYDLDFIMDNMIQNVLYAVSSGVNIFDIIHIGPSHEDIKGLWAGTKYHLVGWGMDEKGTPTTTPKEFGVFTTLSDEYESDCKFTIDCPIVQDKDIQIHIVPTDNTIRYYVACVEESKCLGYDDDQMATRLLNMENNRFEQGFYGADANWGNVDWVLSGEQTKWGRKDLDWTFSPNHSYRIYVFGVNSNGVRNTEVARIDQTTPSATPSDLVVEISLDEASYDKATFTFTPSNDDEYYIPLLVETSELQYVTNPDGTLNEVELCDEISHYYDDTPNYYTMQGKKSRTFNWISDTDYTMLVCGWSGGNTTHFYSYNVHTPKIPFNEGKGDVACKWELMDGTELSQIDYNRWKDYQDMVVIRLEFEPNEDAAFYCGGVWMPESTYEDVGGDDYLLMLIQNPDVSIVNRPSAMYRTLTYGTTYSLSYIAKDSEGRFGPWHYEEFTPTKGVNITPAYDFWSKPSSAPSKVYAIAPDGTTKEIKMASFGKSKDSAADNARVSSRQAEVKKAPVAKPASDQLGKK